MYVGFVFEFSGEWAPLVPKLQGIGNPICGPRMQLMKKRELIVEKSSSRKVCFLHDSETLKIVHRF